MSLGSDLVALAGSFKCGHQRVPKNCYVAMSKRRLYVICKTCKKRKSQQWHRDNAKDAHRAVA